MVIWWWFNGDLNVISWNLMVIVIYWWLIGIYWWIKWRFDGNLLERGDLLVVYCNSILWWFDGDLLVHCDLPVIYWNLMVNLMVIYWCFTGIGWYTGDLLEFNGEFNGDLMVIYWNLMVICWWFKGIWWFGDLLDFNVPWKEQLSLASWCARAARAFLTTVVPCWRSIETTVPLATWMCACKTIGYVMHPSSTSLVVLGGWPRPSRWPVSMCTGSYRTAKPRQTSNTKQTWQGCRLIRGRLGTRHG